MRDTVLVTGGAGFIGSNFVLEWIRKTSSAAINLDLLTYAGNPANLSALDGSGRYTLVRGDICDGALVGRLLAQYQPRAIVHFAGLVSTATMRPALAITAPCTTDRPMPPSPNTATVSPGCTLAVLNTAPMPVVTPQPI